MKRLLTLLTIFFSAPLFGQNNVEKRLHLFQDSLIQNNIDTILNYSLICVGSIYPVDTCNWFDDYYLFWQQRGKTFLQKFDKCKLYKPVSLDTLNPLIFYIVQQKNIDREIIYPPTYTKSKHGDTTITIEQAIDHTCFYHIKSLIKKKKMSKTVSEYDLRFKMFDDGRMNIYYNYNQHTQLKNLIDHTNEIIKNLNINKAFEVQ